MCGCFSLAMVSASRWKRSRNSAFNARCSGSTLMATSRPSRVSRALYTSPIPPAPSGASISKCPIFIPAERLIALSISPRLASYHSPYATRYLLLHRHFLLQLLKPVQHHIDLSGGGGLRLNGLQH